MLLKKLLERLSKKEKQVAEERRKFARLVYPPKKRPKFKVREQEMEVIDISEKGIKFLKNKQAEISECVHGTTELLSGNSLDITGKIVWEHNSEVGVLITKIPESIIVEEIRTILRDLGPGDSDQEK
ncbi:MAG: PilZ domain-containing protein [Desulfobacterales bacterium]|uniref:PilZ domain-containing protein n=1 Tax=Candidatus Desulfatibia profunda TaxID=2841695 RepID=A0A8J6TIC2_9BACT|nr:PilZ domain-containing protein [Candidatus Desulfatibia profunda]MBL7181408.1 PilZ domain-containing protein [Desulfobacterales bacterium]